IVTGTENGAQSIASVRIHQERSSESQLFASVSAFGDTHNLALKRIRIPPVRVHELVSGESGTFKTVDRTERQLNNRFYFDKNSQALLYMNSDNALEGMLTNSVGLRYENNQHIASKIRKKSEGFCGERTIDDFETVSTQSIPSADSRQGTSYSIEVAVMVDSILYNKFPSESDMINYLRVYWYLVDRRFKTVDCASIDILLTQILYSTSSSHDTKFMNVTSFNSSDLDASINTAAKFFANTSISSFDLAHVMSGRDFYRISGGTKYYSTTGIAYLGGVCRRYSTMAYNTALSEDSGFYDGVMTTAHEIGHNLGA
ncbi:Peptidase M12B ADAM/reprolysin, partial [Trinorchestia longiramus]